MSNHPQHLKFIKEHLMKCFTDPNGALIIASCDADGENIECSFLGCDPQFEVLINELLIKETWQRNAIRLVMNKARYVAERDGKSVDDVLRDGVDTTMGIVKDNDIKYPEA